MAIVGSWLRFLKLAEPQEVFYEDLRAIHKISQAYESKQDSYSYVTSLIEDMDVSEIEKVLL